MVKDLGIAMLPDLSCGAQVLNVCSRASRMLEFIARFTRGITDPAALKTIYCALVRQTMEFSAVVWSPHQLGHIAQIQRVQDRFARLVGVRVGTPYREVHVGEMQQLLGLYSLEDRRQIQDVLILFKLIRGYIDCPELLGRVDLRVLCGTRSVELFERGQHGRNYSFHKTMARIQRTGNQVSATTDFFNDGPQRFKKSVTSLLTAPRNSTS
jgi:hypothetical protein